jgi:hypothetical protein
MIHDIAVKRRKSMFRKVLCQIVEKRAAQISRHTIACGSIVNRRDWVRTVS